MVAFVFIKFLFSDNDFLPLPDTILLQANNCHVQCAFLCPNFWGKNKGWALYIGSAWNTLYLYVFSNYLLHKISCAMIYSQINAKIPLWYKKSSI